MKRLNRKGPFYLLRTEEGSITRFDHRVTPSRQYEVPINVYVVVWNDGEKTKMGAFKDYMYSRLGITTMAILSGDTMADVGSNIAQSDFEAMLAVRQGRSELPHFDTHTLVGVI